jgi:hypothetical protein
VPFECSKVWKSKARMKRNYWISIIFLTGSSFFRAATSALYCETKCKPIYFLASKKEGTPRISLINRYHAISTCKTVSTLDCDYFISSMPAISSCPAASKLLKRI